MVSEHGYCQQQNSAKSPKNGWRTILYRSQHGSEFFFFLIKLGAKNYKFGESQIATISREPREELETGKSERKSFFEPIAYSKNKEKREKEV